MVNQYGKFRRTGALLLAVDSITSGRLVPKSSRRAPFFSLRSPISNLSPNSNSWMLRRRYRLDEDRKGFQKAKDWINESWPTIAHMKELVKPVIWMVVDIRENKIRRSYVNSKFWVTTFSTQFWTRANCPRPSSQSSSRALSDAPNGVSYNLGEA